MDFKPNFVAKNKLYLHKLLSQKDASKYNKYFNV